MFSTTWLLPFLPFRKWPHLFLYSKDRRFEEKVFSAFGVKPMYQIELCSCQSLLFFQLQRTREVFHWRIRSPLAVISLFLGPLPTRLSSLLCLSSFPSPVDLRNKDTQLTTPPLDACAFFSPLTYFLEGSYFCIIPWHPSALSAHFHLHTHT